MNTTNEHYIVLLAKFPGLCACGGTVGVNDPIRYEPATKRVVACYGCTENLMGGHAWKFKGDASDHSASQLRVSRTNDLVNARASVARWTKRLVTETADPAKIADRLARAKVELARAEAEVRGQKGERPWAKPSARDIELAEIKRAERLARQEREDAEERACA